MSKIGVGAARQAASARPIGFEVLCDPGCGPFGDDSGDPRVVRGRSDGFFAAHPEVSGVERPGGRSDRVHLPGVVVAPGDGRAHIHPKLAGARTGSVRGSGRALVVGLTAVPGQRPLDNQNVTLRQLDCPVARASQDE